MNKQKRIRDYGIVIGHMPTGQNNALTDVPGVRVGHVTLSRGAVQTGVTAIIPHSGNLFRDKMRAAVHVVNGFGKTAGLVQLEELGTLETPLLLTNTLSVGTVWEGLVRYMLDTNPEIGLTTGTVNPVVAECNDGYLNAIRGGHVRPEHVAEAIRSAAAEFGEGACGAGTGMSCYGLKGGIGSASRRVSLQAREYILGVLVLANFGRLPDFTLNGRRVGERIEQLQRERGELSAIVTPLENKEKGSVIIVIATDIPASERQLQRLARRATIGLARTGSFLGNGSGDIAMAFSTANPVRHFETEDIVVQQEFNENRIDDLFRSVAEATEEAVLNALVCAETTVGRDGNVRHSLREYLEALI
ncbi:MAG TPA: P1 family peptidase [Patescibacteria group bacterium]|nr:P1 family peptidase [Patescibacteria group bacterium]